MRPARAALLALALCSCAEPLAPGEFGVFRYAGNVRGAPPIALLPPLSDRAGNAYVLYGALDLLEAKLFVGHAGGGWSADDDCEIVGGADFGVHGWVGRSEEMAWYWSGEVLVAASGQSGACGVVLGLDPASGAKLSMRAIVPWVRETPTRTTTLAWVQSATDPRPFQVVVDLDNEVYVDAQEVTPDDATDFEVLGVGGNLDEPEGLVVARYRRGESIHVEARFIDIDASTSEITDVEGLDTLPPYGIVGHLQPGEAGLYAGVDVEGQLVLIDRSGGERKAVSGMTAVGVHEWEGTLWLVGHDNGRPVVAEIDIDGEVGDVQTWDASREAEDSLGSRIDVLDDRALPTRQITWDDPKNAIGPAMFVSPHRLDHYADGTTSWLVAGPDFESGGDVRTAIAYAPVGVSYP